MTNPPPEQRPVLSPSLTGAELQRWYWLKAELVAFARIMGVSTSGGKQDLAARLVAALDGLPLPSPSPGRRGTPTARQLKGPLTRQTVIPSGQRCSQELRAFFTAQIGPSFHFDEAMRRFVADGAGRTLGEAVDHWAATRDAPTGEIGAQFELNRFLRRWRAAHPGAGRADAVRAWREYRALPTDART